MPISPGTAGMQHQEWGKIPLDPTARPQVPKSGDKKSCRGSPHTIWVPAPQDKQSDPKGAPGKGEEEKSKPQDGVAPTRMLKGATPAWVLAGG